MKLVYFFYCKLYLTATKIHLSSHKVVVKPLRDTLSFFVWTIVQPTDSLVRYWMAINTRTR